MPSPALVGLVLILLANAIAQTPSASRTSDEQLLVVSSDDGKAGFIDHMGRLVVPLTFDSAMGFSEGFAPVMVANQWGFIDRTGKFVITPRFGYARPFHEGLAEIEVGGMWGFALPNGDYAISPRFDNVHRFIEGFAVVELNHKMGVVDKRGKLVVEPTFDAIGFFHNGIFNAARDGQELFINSRGEEVSEPPRAPSESFPKFQNGKWGFVTGDGRIVRGFEFDGAQEFSEGLAAVEVQGYWGFVSSDGRLAIPPQFGDGKWPPERCHDCGLAGPPVGRFRQGLAPVETRDGWVFIDKQGDVRIAGPFYKASSFENGAAQVCGKERCGWIDLSGRTLWPWLSER